MSPDRLQELLVEQAVRPLSAQEALELEHLLDAPSEFELAAAACHLALAGTLEPAPADLLKRLKADAKQASEQPASRQPASRQVDKPEFAGQPQQQAPPKLQSPSTPWTGILLAAAGLFAMAGFWALQQRSDAKSELEQLQASLQEASPEQALDQLLAQAPVDLIRKPFAAGNDATGQQAKGEVIWSTAQQTGYLRLSGLTPNQASIEQYQLWIFDEARGDSPPVDGGVFNVSGASADGTLTIPIDAKVLVSTPILFAVTVESPGGVVVSDRSRIALAAEI